MIKNKYNGIILIIIGIIFIVVPLVLKINNQIISEKAKYKTDQIVYKIEESENIVENQIGHIKEEEVIIDNTEYIGVIEIPAINIKLPVISSCSEEKLKISSCRYSGSISENNMIIAAHNYSSQFGKLKNLKSNDIIYFADVEGNYTSYQVSEIDKISGNDVDKMKNTDYALTLFTCTDSGRNRLAVRCNKI